MKGKSKGAGFYIIVLIIFIGALSVFLNQGTEKQVLYSDIVGYFTNEQVKNFRVSDKTLIMELKDSKVVEYELASVDMFYYDMGELVERQYADGIIESYDYAVSSTSWWISMLPSLLLTVVLVLFWVFMINRADGGAGKAMSFGRSRARMINADEKKVTFGDVAGADEEKAELQEIVEFLKSPRKFIEIGARIPKGVLLVGPPGTGKTLIAKAVAGEAGVPFFTISGSDFVELYVGVGASRVRDLFAEAKKNAPAIIFIDEIDAVGRRRGAGLGGGHDEREQTLNQLLVEMDGFGENVGIIIIAATNRPDILDPALLRPGRFDRQVYVGMPDIKGRQAILAVHAKNKPFEENVSFENLAKSTAGFTGADLENLLNEAALLAARRNRKKISNADLDKAFLKVIMGTEKKSRVISEKERRLTAYHEAGHALVTRLLPSQDPVHQVSIIPRGRAGGFTLSLPQEDKSYAAKSEMLDEIIVFLGGRAAEKIVLDDISTGASNDIERATEIVRKMVTRYGMSDKLGPIAFNTSSDEVFLGRDFGTTRNYSEQIAAQIDQEIEAIIKQAYDRCCNMLTENIQTLHRLAEYLLEHETMDGTIFEKIFNNEPILPEDIKAEPEPVPEQNAAADVDSDLDGENTDSAECGRADDGAADGDSESGSSEGDGQSAAKPTGDAAPQACDNGGECGNEQGCGDSDSRSARKSEDVRKNSDGAEDSKEAADSCAGGSTAGKKSGSSAAKILQNAKKYEGKDTKSGKKAKKKKK